MSTRSFSATNPAHPPQVTINDLQALARSMNSSNTIQDRRTQELEQFTKELTAKITRNPHGDHSQDLLLLQRLVKPVLPNSASHSVGDLLTLQRQAQTKSPS